LNLPPHVTATDRAEWDAWLEANHELASEIWVVYWKKGTGKPSIAWAEAVEVALKYGWIDGLIKTIDESRYMQRWTPRRPKSKWSKVNRDIALRLIETGEMTPRGLAAVDAAKASGEWERAYTVQPPTPVPADLKAALKANPAAKAQQQRLGRVRWDRWLAWLDGTEGRTRTRRLNMIVRALESRDYAPVDAAAQRKS
jgi:uncharacterized protein YdeI (YjbR/CyaY-like superfamily)